MSKSWHVDGPYQYDQGIVVWCINTIIFISCPSSTESLILPRSPGPRRHMFLTKLIYSRCWSLIFAQKNLKKVKNTWLKRWCIFVRTQNKDGLIIRSAVIWWRGKEVLSKLGFDFGESERVALHFSFLIGLILPSLLLFDTLKFTPFIY